LCLDFEKDPIHPSPLGPSILTAASSSSAPCAPPSLLASSIFLPNRWEFLLAHRFDTTTSRLGERKGKEEGQEGIFVWFQVMIGSLFSLSFPCGLLGLGPKIAAAIVGVKMHLLYSFSR
jgi:hypothetical protein